MSVMRRAVMWLLCGSAVVCLVVLLYGRLRAPTRLSEIGLERCAGVVCVRGITPGKTTWAQAQIALRPDATSVDDKIITLGHIRLLKSVDRMNVGRVLITPGASITLGWIIQRYGTPCGVSVYRQLGVVKRLVTVRYPGMLVNLRAEDAVLRPRTPVQNIDLYDPAHKSTVQPNLCIDNVTDGARNYEWRGFVSLRYHLTHPQHLLRFSP